MRIAEWRQGSGGRGRTSEVKGQLPVAGRWEPCCWPIGRFSDWRMVLLLGWPREGAWGQGLGIRGSDGFLLTTELSKREWVDRAANGYFLMPLAGPRLTSNLGHPAEPTSYFLLRAIDR
jgi:hypothetical protein